MPKYEISEDEEFAPTVSFPADKSILGELKIGRKIEILSTGKVTALQDSRGHRSFELEVASIEAYGENEFEQMTREDED